MCDVDLLIVSEGQIRVIVDIEESGFLPTKICGKFLQLAFATHFIHDLRPEPEVPNGNRVLFVQELDASKCLKLGTLNDSQAEMIEQKIRNILPLKGSTITAYYLFLLMASTIPRVSSLSVQRYRMLSHNKPFEPVPFALSPNLVGLDNA